ncbi:MAG TPA: hypothetical protein VFV59_02885, partial [Candidatus Limnocylindria bacterium]|nr:hypothetical protein [Candidatus Limnocylindria bacterium]
MTDRLIAQAVTERLGPESLARLRQLRRRLWWRRSARIGLVIAAGTVLGVALVQLASRAFPFEWAPLVQLAIGLVGLLTWVAASIGRRPTLVQTAWLADEELGLRQRLGTALELAAHEDQDVLQERQLADARARLAAVEVRRAFRPRVARRPAVVAGVGLAMTLLLVAWPNPQDAVIEQRRASREAAEQVAERVEEVADEVGEENVENPDPRREELERQLRELARQLREGGDDREETLARIGSVQEELSRQTDPRAAERDAGLSQLARAASRAATGDEEANPEGDPEQAATDLEELADRAADLPENEMGQRADALRQAAQSGAASQPAAAAALTEAADALDEAARTGNEQDRQAAEEALRRAADALRRAESDR